MSGARALSDQSGYTLPELLVALVVSLLVVAGAGTMVMITVKAQPRTSDRAAQIQQGRVMLERITRELRQGQSVTQPTSSSLQLKTFVPTTMCGSGNPGPARLCSVTYLCSSAECFRTERQANGGEPVRSEKVVEGLRSGAIFSYQGDPPKWVGVTLQFPSPEGEETVTLSDGVYLRNYQEAPQG